MILRNDDGDRISKSVPGDEDDDDEFAGPLAQGVLDPVIVPCPMSHGCAGLIDSIVLLKDNAFLGTSAHESVLLPATCRRPAGYLPATCLLAKR